MKKMTWWLAAAASLLALEAPAQDVSIEVRKLGEGEAYAAISPSGDVCRIPCTLTVASGSNVSLRLIPEVGSTQDGWMLPCVDMAVCTLNNVTTSRVLHAIVVPGHSNGLTLVPATTGVVLAATPVGTVGPTTTLQLRNDNSSAVTVTGASVAAPFELTQACTGAVLQPGTSCPLSVRINHVLHPTETPGIKATSLVIATNAPVDPEFFVDVAGSLQGDLTTHFYQQILGRDPDAGGKAFWEGEAARVQAMGASPNFVYQALAVQLFGSAEYKGRNFTPRDTLEHIYRAFLSRASDTDGVDFYMPLSNAGMPPEGWIPAFAFSPEFAQLTERVLGPAPTARPEVDLVMDLYRGTLRRLPDTAGFQFWLGQFRQAQCTGNEAVRATAEQMASFFLNSPEYQQQFALPNYVAHLYDAFMRRTPELGGWNFWFGSLNTNPTTAAIENTRAFFANSPEFQGRVQAVMAAGCVQ